MKKFLISFFIAVSFFSTVVYAGTLVKKVYFSPYPILIDNEEYSSETPILQYQDRTYVALREFSEMVGVGVDFDGSRIIINTSKLTQKDLTNINDTVATSKENIALEDDNALIQKEESDDINQNVRIVYISKTGKKYHNLSNCNGAKYNAISISDAIKNGYTPCLRCAKEK